MKFGKVDDPSGINFNLPADHPDTRDTFTQSGQKEKPALYIGCAKWNRQDLKGFYPRGTKDELTYYSSQFNCIELNATFYRIFPPAQFEKWKEKTPEYFKFFPKLSQDISHFKQLKDVEDTVNQYLDSVLQLEEKLGTLFLQLHTRFGPNGFDKLTNFVESWPKEIPLAVEVRHPDWFQDQKLADDLFSLLRENGIANILVDTAGRRDMMHMRMSTPKPFIRWVGANHSSDYDRLDQWAVRIGEWIEQGMSELHFFVHQNLEKESPLLSAYLIRLLNDKYGYDIHIPGDPNPGEDLFT